MAHFRNFSSIRSGAVGSIVRAALAALTGAALFVSATGDAEAYEVKRTPSGELVHWEERSIAYTIDSSVERAVPRAAEATAHAMDSWSGTVGAPDLEAVPTDERSPTKPGFDRRNGIFYRNGSDTPMGRALAITILTYDNVSGAILDADVVFNGSYAFAVLETASSTELAQETLTAAHPSNTDTITHDGEADTALPREHVYDLHHVIAHELGHSLGMNDEMDRKDALMYRFSAPNDASIRAPRSDDIAGLAELYGSKLEARGNGCGSATVAPKKPSSAASHAAMIATVGLLLFLVLRARSDRRARLGFVLAAATSAIAFVPDLSPARAAPPTATSTGRALGHARAKVLGTSTAIEGGLFKTTYELATTTCRAARCPKTSHGTTWGGTIGTITQEVGGYYAPSRGDEVDVSFANLPTALGPMTKPLAGRVTTDDVRVRVVTRADRREGF